MKEKDLPFDHTKHAVYTKNAKKCVQKLLRRYYDEKTAAELWEKIQLQYCEYLKDEPALAGSKITVSIYDPILIFAWYAVIPDNDSSFNFIVGMLYTQLFQQLYYQADVVHGGRLPIHVHFVMDEFANVALPDDYCSLLSTMRSREISSIIIIQNLAQIKALFKDTWETIPGNCDTLIYLGGNEQSTHKYVSELLGKATIDKKTHGDTRGKQGSSSRNFDVIGRELMTADEARKFDNRKCFGI